MLLLVLAVMGVNWAKTSRRAAHLSVATSLGLVLLFSASIVVIGPERAYGVYSTGARALPVLIP